jgi:hypothetical protein
VTLLALAVAGATAWLVLPVMRGTGVHRSRGLFIAAAVVAATALLAAESLWSLRPRAFALFCLWSVAAIVMFVLFRFATSGSSHLVRFVPTILYAGIAFGAAALYLRRAL